MALKFTVRLPSSPAKDLGKRVMHVSLQLPDASTVEKEETLGADALIYELIAERDTLVSLFLVDVDTSGNHSAPSPTLTFKAADIFPPPAPGDLVLEHAEEI